MLFALCFFHALALGRRKFGFQGFSRQYPFNNGDITVCAKVMHMHNLPRGPTYYYGYTHHGPTSYYGYPHHGPTYYYGYTHHGLTTSYR